jgi:hypothetical protein
MKNILKNHFLCHEAMNLDDLISSFGKKTSQAQD